MSRIWRSSVVLLILTQLTIDGFANGLPQAGGVNLTPDRCALADRRVLATNLTNFPPFRKLVGNRFGDLVAVTMIGTIPAIHASFRHRNGSWNSAPVPISPPNGANHIKFLDAAVDIQGTSMIFYAVCSNFSGSATCTNANQVNVFSVTCNANGVCGPSIPIAVPSGEIAAIYGSAAFALGNVRDGVFTFMTRLSISGGFARVYAYKLSNGQLLTGTPALLDLVNPSDDISVAKLFVDDQGRGVVENIITDVTGSYPNIPWRATLQTMRNSAISSWGSPRQLFSSEQSIEFNQADVSSDRSQMAFLFTERHPVTGLFNYYVRRVISGIIRPLELLNPSNSAFNYPSQPQLGIDDFGIISIGWATQEAQPYPLGMLTAFSIAPEYGWIFEPVVHLPSIGDLESAYDVSPKGFQFYSYADGLFNHRPAIIYLARGLGSRGFVADNAPAALNNVLIIEEPNYTLMGYGIKAYGDNNLAVVGLYSDIATAGAPPYTMIVHECE